jgi:hypothetical protein
MKSYNSNDFGCFASNKLLVRLQTITLVLPYKFKEQVYSQYRNKNVLKLSIRKPSNPKEKL